MSNAINSPAAAVPFYKRQTAYTRLNTSLKKSPTETKKMVLVSLYLIAYVLISVIYVLYTSTVWAYIGLELSVNHIKIAASLAVLITFVALIPTRWSARTFFLNIIVTAYLLPSLIIYGFSDRPTSSAVLIWLALAIVYGVSGFRIPRLKILTVNPREIVWFLLALSAVLVVMFYALGGFNYFNLDFSKVYEFRSVAADSLPGIFGYLSLLFTTAIIPFGIAISLCYKKYVNVVIFTAISIVLFGLTSHKAMVIMPFLSIGVFVLLSRRPSFVTIISAFCVILFVVSLAVIFDSNISPASIWGGIETMFVRRALFVPAMIDYDYIEFFSGETKYYWSTSKLSLGLLDIPYNGVPPPLLVGMAYFGPGNSANTGFIGSGFAQAGVSGILIYAVGVGLIIGFFQTCSRHLGVPLVITATIGLFSSMIQSTDFVTLFLTHGLLPALLVFASLRDQVVPGQPGAIGRQGAAPGAPILPAAIR